MRLVNNNNNNNQDILKTISNKNILVRVALFIVGLFIMSISFNLFLLPNEIVYGGISGLSITIKRLFDTDPAMFIFVTSMLLLIVSYLMLGKKKTLNSVIGSLLFPLFIKLTEDIVYLIVLEEKDMLLMAIFGGLLTGFGLGLVFKAGFTTGGTDIVNHIIHKYLKVSIGNAILITDGLIILISSFVIGPEIALYGVIVLYIVSIMADKVLLGISGSKAFYIVTSKEKEIQKFLLEHLNTGVTVIDGKGGFTGKNHKVLMCVISTRDYFKIKEAINEIDEHAFFVVTDSYEVSGGKGERMII